MDGSSNLIPQNSPANVFIPPYLSERLEEHYRGLVEAEQRQDIPHHIAEKSSGLDNEKKYALQSHFNEMMKMNAEQNYRRLVQLTFRVIEKEGSKKFK